MTQQSIKEPTPFAAGAEAFKKGKDIHKANPYVKGSLVYMRFVNGWQAEQTKADKAAATAQLEVIDARPLDAWAMEVAGE